MWMCPSSSRNTLASYPAIIFPSSVVLLEPIPKHIREGRHVIHSHTHTWGQFQNLQSTQNILQTLGRNWSMWRKLNGDDAHKDFNLNSKNHHQNLFLRLKLTDL